MLFEVLCVVCCVAYCVMRYMLLSRGGYGGEIKGARVYVRKQEALYCSIIVNVRVSIEQRLDFQEKKLAVRLDQVEYVCKVPLRLHQKRRERIGEEVKRVNTFHTHSGSEST